MKTLSERFDKSSLQIKFYDYNGQITKDSYFTSDDISKSNEDLELLKSLFDGGTLMQMTARDIADYMNDKSFDEVVTLFTNSGKYLELDDFTCCFKDEESEDESNENSLFSFSIIRFTDQNIFSGEVIDFEYNDVLNVFFSDFKPLEVEKELVSELDEDLKWLLE